mmetsp:Transcript_7705/g.10716  ORF Transcript_7705/g.10716 Transcript_7705/m.10716 type:complete len:151 (+) Transcript_7705:73-525(+)
MNSFLHVVKRGNGRGGIARVLSQSAHQATESRVLPRRRALPSPLTVTQGAEKRIDELIRNKDPPPSGVIIGVRRRGCNGLSYTLNYVEDRPKAHEEVKLSNGQTVYIDPAALFHLVGTVMDYEETALSSGFTFTNPNEKGRCGCGESFSV